MEQTEFVRTSGLTVCRAGCQRRVENDRQQRVEEAEAQHKRQAGDVTAEREHTPAMLHDQLASMRQIIEKRSGDRTDVAQDEPDGSILAESRGVFGASQG